ncbi:MAG TPA: serine/threonine-protein kinase [Polyangiaceae bacterium]|nr:serine/threonine-protein kinase [Polyangiaceae bacterium]
MGSNPPPEVIVGRYALYRKIASGGMATVYLARLLGPVGFSRTVAIKRLLPQFARDPEFVTMFLDEARLAARLRHPNIVPTLDVVATKGEAFLVMEYVQGESLAQLLRSTAMQSEPIPLRIAASIVSGALLGLHAAHEARDGRGMPLNLVHRDVSPHNILVGTDGTARLLDFGVAKAEGRAQHLTREGHIKGKLGYMAPEQLSGDGVTRESDIYSAAVVLWETLVGRKVFAGTHDAIAYVRAQHPRIDPPSKYRSDVTSEMDQIVLKGMRWDPADRFATAREMAAAIERAVGAVSVLEVAEWLEIVAGQRIHLRAQELVAFEHSSGAKMPVADDLNTQQTVAPLPSLEPSAEETTVPEAERLPSAQASENPMPIELPLDQTSAASPRARATRTLFRRARVVAGAVGIAALGLLSAVSVASVGSRTRARATKVAAVPPPPPPAGAGVWGAQWSAASAAGGSGSQAIEARSSDPASVAPILPSMFDVATDPGSVSGVALAAPLAGAPVDTPPAVPVTSLPVANSKSSAAARKAAASRSHATSKASAKAASPGTRPVGADAKTEADAPAKALSPFDAIGGRE